MTASEEAIRVELVRFARQMIGSGLVRGTSGNISAREPAANWCLITPSGVEYETLEPEQLVVVRLDGARPPDQLNPSVDTPVHLGVYRGRPDVAACIHTHSPYAAAFSTVGREIPALITESAGGGRGARRGMGPRTPAR